MQPTSANGDANSTRVLLDSVRQAVERLEADLQKQKEENQQLRAERDQYRRLLLEQVKHFFGDAKEWDGFDKKDYDVTVDDLLAVIDSKQTEDAAMSPNEAEYSVEYSRAILAQLNDHVDALLRAGWKKASLAALIKALDDRLKCAPVDFGEPLYALHSVKITVSVGFVRPFAVQFGVHEQSKSVFVRKLVLMTTEPSQ